jgi:hypothetical protein
MPRSRPKCGCCESPRGDDELAADSYRKATQLFQAAAEKVDTVAEVSLAFAYSTGDLFKRTTSAPSRCSGRPQTRGIKSLSTISASCSERVAARQGTKRRVMRGTAKLAGFHAIFPELVQDP